MDLFPRTKLGARSNEQKDDSIGFNIFLRRFILNFGTLNALFENLVSNNLTLTLSMNLYVARIKKACFRRSDLSISINSHNFHKANFHNALTSRIPTTIFAATIVAPAVPETCSNPTHHFSNTPFQAYPDSAAPCVNNYFDCLSTVKRHAVPYHTMHTIPKKNIKNKLRHTIKYDNVQPTLSYLIVYLVYQS